MRREWSWSCNCCVVCVCVRACMCACDCLWCQCQIYACMNMNIVIYGGDMHPFNVPPSKVCRVLHYVGKNQQDGLLIRSAMERWGLKCMQVTAAAYFRRRGCILQQNTESRPFHFTKDNILRIHSHFLGNNDSQFLYSHGLVNMESLPRTSP